MPKRLATRYPSSAIDEYTLALQNALAKWFIELKQKLFSVTDSEVKIADSVDRELNAASLRWQASAALLGSASLQSARNIARHADRNMQRIFNAAEQSGQRVNRDAQPGRLLNLRMQQYLSDNARLVSELGDSAIQRIRSSLSQGSDLASAMNQAEQSSMSQARMLARNQASQLNADLSRIRAVEADSNEYIWRHSGNPRYRPAHIALNGQTRSYNDDPYPGTVPNCGCQAVPLFEDDGRISKVRRARSISVGVGRNNRYRGPSRLRTLALGFSLTWDNPLTDEKAAIKAAIEANRLKGAPGYLLESTIAERYFDLVREFSEDVYDPISGKRAGDRDILLENLLIEVTVSSVAKKIDKVDALLDAPINPKALKVLIVSTYLEANKREVQTLERKGAKVVILDMAQTQPYSELDRIVEQYHGDFNNY